MIDGNIDVVELNGDLIDYVSIEGELLPIGPKGDKGDPGDPGFSPQVDISKVGNATTLTIVDQQGTHQSVIYDGTGDMNKSVYDTDNDGIVDNAERVNGHTVATDVPADAQFTDTTYTAGVGIEITAGNVINNTQTSAEWGNITGTLSDQTDLKNALDSKADSSSIPTKVSDLNNDTGFITKAVNDLTNYYTTSNTYTKTEVNNLIGQLDEFKIQVVQTLPVSDIDTHTIYLVPKTGSTGDVYDEYLYINNAWELIGSTSVDLTNYPTFTDYPTAGGRAGVIANGNGLSVGTMGVPSAAVYSAYDYGNREVSIFVSKGTLDNLITANGWNGKENASNKVISISSQSTDTQYPSAKCVYDNVSAKQDTLVSGTNIKTINSTSLLGSGDIEIQADPEIAVSTTTPIGEECLWINPEEDYVSASGSRNNFKLLTGTFTVSQTTGTQYYNGSDYPSLPEGYTKENTIVMSAVCIPESNNAQFVLPYLSDNGTDVFTITASVSTQNNELNIYFTTNINVWDGTTFTYRVVIAKTTDFN